MSFLNDTPLLMLIAFLLLTLVVGIYCKGKPISLREYAIGNKQFATATLVATMLATRYSGAVLIRNVEQIYLQGFYWIIIFFSSNLGYWVMSPLILRMGPFMGHLSLAETIGYSYGATARIFSVLLCMLSYVFCLSSQITALSTAIQMCTGVDDPRFMTAAATSILIAYSSFGGIRSVTFTDVLQLITFCLIIPLLAIKLLHQVGSKPIIASLQAYPRFQLASLCHWDKKFLAMAALFLANVVSFIKPATIQRIYMAAGPIQARKLLCYGGIFSLMIRVCIIFLALFLFVKNPFLTQKAIWLTIIANLTPVFKGLIAISLVAMAMSTADSQLNTSAVMVSHDFREGLKSLVRAPSHPPCASFIRTLLRIIDAVPSLQLARWATIIMGVMAMLVALVYNDLLKLMILVLNFSVPVTVAPYLLALYGLRSSSHTALIGMVTGIITIAAWNKWIKPTTGIDGSFCCMLINGLAMVAAHYLLPQPEGKGWATPDDEYQAIQQSKARAAKRKRSTF